MSQYLEDVHESASIFQMTNARSYKVMPRHMIHSEYKREQRILIQQNAEVHW